MTRAADQQDGYSDFGGGTSKAWLRVKAPANPSLQDGTGIADRPSGLVLEAVSDAGVVTTYWMWVDSNGLLHLSSSEPTNQDETTTFAAPKKVTVSTIGLDPNATIIAGSVVGVATAITGVAAGDLVLIERQNWQSGVTGYFIEQIAKVTTDTITVFFRAFGAAVTPEPETVRYTWFDFT